MKLAAALAISASLALPAGAHAAEAFYGVTDGNVLISFQSDNTRNLEVERPIFGLPDGEAIVGIDVRPSTGQLYALGKQGRLYVLEPRTGEAFQIGDPFTPALVGTVFGFDFNPVADRIRITTDGEQNLRVNPDTGEVISDAPLAYAAGDPAFGANPSVGASAYSNNIPGAAETALYDIDDERGALVLQDPPNAGTLKTIGALGGDGTVFAFDISTGNAAFAAWRASDDEARLLQIDLATGAARDAGPDPVIAGRAPIRAMAAVGEVPDDDRAPAISVAMSSVQLDTSLLRRGIKPTIACDEACRAEVTVRLGGRLVGVGSSAVPRRAGRASVTAPLNDRARRAVRRGNPRFTVRVTVTDGAGNTVRTTRNVRAQRLRDRRG